MFEINRTYSIQMFRENNLSPSPDSELTDLIATSSQYKNDDDLARRRVQRWCESYPPIADRHADSSGRRPVHSFFYPEEEYKDYHLYPLAELCKAGYGDVEIHLHHDNDTADGLKAKINSFKDSFQFG